MNHRYAWEQAVSTVPLVAINICIAWYCIHTDRCQYKVHWKKEKKVQRIQIKCINHKSMHYDNLEFGSEMFLMVIKKCNNKEVLMVKVGWQQIQQGNGKDDCVHTFPKHILFHNREDTFSKLTCQILTWWDWWPLDEWRAPKYTCRHLGFTLIYFYYLFVEIS